MERCRRSFAPHHGQVQVRRCVGSNCGWQGSDLSKYSQKDDGRYRSQIPEEEAWSKPWERSRLIPAWRGASKRLASIAAWRAKLPPFRIKLRTPIGALLLINWMHTNSVLQKANACVLRHLVSGDLRRGSVGREPVAKLLGHPVDEYAQARRQLARVRIENMNRQRRGRKASEHLDQRAAGEL
jgi:hypothetical protein